MVDILSDMTFFILAEFLDQAVQDFQEAARKFDEFVEKADKEE